MNWKKNYKRAFLSHTHDHAPSMGRLAKSFLSWGVHGFVAHEDIDGGKEWRQELFDALGEADFLVAYVTSDFSASAWTDQEVGIALGRGIPVVPVRMGATPHGFLNQRQAVRHTSGKETHTLAEEILSALERIHPKTGVGILANALAVADSFNSAWATAKALKEVTYSDAEIVDTVVRAARENTQVSGLTRYRLQAVEAAISHLKSLALSSA